MAIIAVLPDGTELEFPEGTDEAVIDRAVREAIGQQTAGDVRSAVTTAQADRMRAARRPDPRDREGEAAMTEAPRRGRPYQPSGVTPEQGQEMARTAQARGNLENPQQFGESDLEYADRQRGARRELDRNQRMDERPQHVRDTLAYIGNTMRRQGRQDFPWLYRQNGRLSNAEIAEIVEDSADQIEGMSPEEATRYLFSAERGNQEMPRFQRDPTEVVEPGERPRERAGHEDFERRPMSMEQRLDREFRREVREQRQSRFGDAGPGFTGGVGQTLLGVIQRTGGGIIGATGTILETLGGETSGTNDLEALGRYVGERGRQRQEAARPDYEEWSPEWLAFEVVRTTAEMGGAIALAAGSRNPALGASLLMGTRVGAERFDESIREGRDPRAALIDGTAYALMEAIPERIALGRIMSPGGRFGESALRRVGRGVVTGFAAEGAQEILTETMQMGYDAGILNEEMTFGEAINRMAQAGLIGGVSGSALGGGFAAAQSPERAAIREIRDTEYDPALADFEARESFRPDTGGVDPDIRPKPVETFEGEEELTEADRASPLPDEIIAAGRSAIRQGTGTSSPPLRRERREPPVENTFDRMVQITLIAEGGGTLESPNVSHRGARGPMQVMPGTDSDPGFGVRPMQNDSEAERARVGRDYLRAMLRRYGGDPAKMWGAYNWGPGNLDDAIARHGDNWLQHAPRETQRYVMGNLARLGGRGFSPETGDVRTLETAEIEENESESAEDFVRRVLGDDFGQESTADVRTAELDQAQLPQAPQPAPDLPEAPPPLDLEAAAAPGVVEPRPPAPALETTTITTPEGAEISGTVPRLPELNAALPPEDAARELAGMLLRAGQTTAGFASNYRYSFGDGVRPMTQADRERHGAVPKRDTINLEISTPDGPRFFSFPRSQIERALPASPESAMPIEGAASPISQSPPGRTAAPRFDPEAFIPQIQEYAGGRGSLEPKAIAAKLGISPKQAEQVLGAYASRPGSGLRISRSGKVRRVSQARGPVDAIRFLRNSGGVRNDPEAGHDLTKGRNWHLAAPGLINRTGRTIDEAGLALWEAGYFPNESDRPTVEQTLEFIEEALRSKAWSLEDEAAVAERFGNEDNRRARENALYQIMDFVQDNGLDMLESEIEDAVDYLSTGDTVEVAVQRSLDDASARSLYDGTDETGRDFYETLAETIYVGDIAEQRGDGAEEAGVGPEGVEGDAGERAPAGVEPAEDAGPAEVESRAGAETAAPAREPTQSGATRPPPLEDAEFERIWKDKGFKAFMKGLPDGSPHRESPVAHEMARGWRDGQTGDIALLDAWMDSEQNFNPLAYQATGNNPRAGYVEAFYGAVTGKSVAIRQRGDDRVLGVAKAADEIESIIEPEAAADRSAQVVTIADLARQADERADMFGEREGDQRRALERQGEGRKRADKTQKPVGSEGGLFDTRDTTGDLLTQPESRKDALGDTILAMDTDTYFRFLQALKPKRIKGAANFSRAMHLAHFRDQFSDDRIQQAADSAIGVDTRSDLETALEEVARRPRSKKGDDNPFVKKGQRFRIPEKIDYLGGSSDIYVVESASPKQAFFQNERTRASSSLPNWQIKRALESGGLMPAEQEESSKTAATVQEETSPSGVREGRYPVNPTDRTLRVDASQLRAARDQFGPSGSPAIRQAWWEEDSRREEGEQEGIAAEREAIKARGGRVYTPEERSDLAADEELARLIRVAPGIREGGLIELDENALIKSDKPNRWRVREMDGDLVVLDPAPGNDLSPIDPITSRLAHAFSQGQARVVNEAPQGELFLLSEDGTPSFDPAILAKLRREFERSKIGDRVLLKTVDLLMNNPKVAGKYQFGIITVALRASQNPQFTLRHEVIHALRDLGLFKGDEWRALERRAKTDTDLMDSIRRRYAGREMSEEAMIEEAVADMYARWRQGRLESGFVREAFQRIMDFFNAIRRAIQRSGTQADIEAAAEAVMRAIESGQLGGRQQGIEYVPPGEFGIIGARFSLLDPDETPATRALFSDNVKERLDLWRTRLQDRMLPLLRVQQRIEAQTGDRLPEALNAYQSEELMAGKVGARLEKLARDMVDPLFEAMRREKVTLDELETWLYARHAPERNARISEINPEFDEGTGSGMTDEEAAAILQAAEDQGKTPALERLAERVDAVLAFALDTRVEAGLLSEAEAATWREQYEHYVPLRGLAEADPEAAAARPVFGGGINVRGPESRMAFGRRSKASNILAYTMLQAEEAVVRAGMNEVAQSFYRLASENPDRNFWQTDKVSRKPALNRDTGQVYYRTTNRLLAEDAQYTVSLKIDGIEHRVTMNRDNAAAVRLASAMRNLNGTDLGSVMQVMAGINRFLSTVNTTLSPEFVITNAFRDIQTASINLSGIDQRGITRGTLRDYKSALKASVKGSFGKDSGEWGKWYREFVEAGGRVYFNRIEDLNEIQGRIEKHFARQRARAKGNPLEHARAGLAATFSFIENVNLGVENAIRLAAYKNAREKGMSKADAASLAKNLTVNFNRRGEWGSAANAMYLFYNASMQGSTRLLQAIRSKRVRRILYVAVATGFVLDLLNSMISDDDEDGESFYDKISEFDKSRNLIFMIPGGQGRHIKIPLPYGYNAFFAMGRAGSEIARRPDGWLESGGNLIKTIVDSFNPVGGTNSILNFIAPTLADPIVDLSLNRDFADRPIMPEANRHGPQEPDSQRYWGSVSPHWRIMTDTMNSLSGGDAIVPGYIDVSPETLEHLGGVVTGAAGNFFIDRVGGLMEKAIAGEAIEANDLPLVRRVVGSAPRWYNKAAFYSRIAEIEQVKANVASYRERGQDDAAIEYEEQNAQMLSMSSAARSARRKMRSIRERRGDLDQMLEREEIDRATWRAERQTIQEEEDAIITEFNWEYNSLFDRRR